VEPRLRIVVRPYGSPIPLGLGGGHGRLRASGWAALAAFVIAVYGGLAFLLEDLAGRTILPLLRRGDARAAIEHDLDAQFAGLPDEAGVRHTL
jgi:uncharacterized protein